MAVRIDKNKCIGCTKCTDVCPGNLLFINGKKKAEIVDSHDCWDCASCLKECPVRAIEMYLQPEIGGRGATMTAKKNVSSIEWYVKERNGNEEIIEVLNSKIL